MVSATVPVTCSGSGSQRPRSVAPRTGAEHGAPRPSGRRFRRAASGPTGCLCRVQRSAAASASTSSHSTSSVDPSCISSLAADPPRWNTAGGLPGDRRTPTPPYSTGLMVAAETDAIIVADTDLRKKGVNETTSVPSRTTTESVCVAALSPSAIPRLNATITALASGPPPSGNDGIMATRPAALPVATMMPRITIELGARWRSRNNGNGPLHTLGFTLALIYLLTKSEGRALRHRCPRDRTLAYWRSSHERYWREHSENPRRCSPTGSRGSGLEARPTTPRSWQPTTCSATSATRSG
jgi:hypothetical protein